MLYSGHSDCDPGVRSAWIKTYTFIEIPDHNWLVVWDMIFFHILGMSSSQLTNSIIFHKGRSTTNIHQPDGMISCYFEGMNRSINPSYFDTLFPGYLLPGCHLLSPLRLTHPSAVFGVAWHPMQAGPPFLQTSTTWQLRAVVSQT